MEHPPENQSLTTTRESLRDALYLGLVLGLIYAVSSTIETQGISAEAFIAKRFLVKLVISCLVGIVLSCCWEMLVTKFSPPGIIAPGESERRRLILIEGGLRFGVPLGLFLAIVSLLRRGDFSLVSLSLELVFSLAFFFLIGCLMGIFMFKFLKVMNRLD